MAELSNNTFVVLQGSASALQSVLAFPMYAADTQYRVCNANGPNACSTAAKDQKACQSLQSCQLQQCAHSANLSDGRPNAYCAMQSCSEYYTACYGTRCTRWTDANLAQANLTIKVADTTDNVTAIQGQLVAYDQWRAGRGDQTQITLGLCLLAPPLGSQCSGTIDITSSFTTFDMPLTPVVTAVCDNSKLKQVPLPGQSCSAVQTCLLSDCANGNCSVPANVSQVEFNAPSNDQPTNAGGAGVSSSAFVGVGIAAIVLMTIARVRYAGRQQSSTPTIGRTLRRVHSGNLPALHNDPSPITIRLQTAQQEDIEMLPVYSEALPTGQVRLESSLMAPPPAAQRNV